VEGCAEDPINWIIAGFDPFKFVCFRLKTYLRHAKIRHRLTLSHCGFQKRKPFRLVDVLREIALKAALCWGKCLYSWQRSETDTAAKLHHNHYCDKSSNRCYVKHSKFLHRKREVLIVKFTPEPSVWYLKMCQCNVSEHSIKFFCFNYV